MQSNIFVASSTQISWIVRIGRLEKTSKKDIQNIYCSKRQAKLGLNYNSVFHLITSRAALIVFACQRSQEKMKSRSRSCNTEKQKEPTVKLNGLVKTILTQRY